MTATSDLIAKNFARDIQDKVEHFAAIWAEEAPHNDFRGMARQLHRLMPTRFTFQRIQPRPFGFTFKVGGEEYRITCTDLDYQWGKIAPEAEAA